MNLLYKDLKDTSKDSLTEMSKDSIRHFLKSFKDEAFTNERGQRRRWKKRVYTTGNKFRGTLTKTGLMRRSFRFKVQNNKAFVFNNAEYSGYHNEGSETIVTAKQIKYFKYRASKAIREDDAEFWWRMASKEIGSKIILPERQFMGESKTLVNKHLKTISTILNSKIKKNNVNSRVKV